MSKNNSKETRGIMFIVAITLVFVTLKVIGVINWSWGVVLFPIYIPIPLKIIAFIFYVIHRTIRVKKLRR